MICQGFLRNGQYCHYIARYNGYCAHHRDQLYNLNREISCRHPNCSNVLHNQSIYCFNHRHLEILNRCYHRYLNGSQCTSVVDIDDIYCHDHSIQHETFHFMTWGPKNLIKHNKINPTKIILLDLIENPCSICLEDFKTNDQLYELKCKHLYHQKCLNEWMDINDTCPLDRSKIE